MTENSNSKGQLAPLAYSVDEACKVSSLGRTYIYQLINEGRLQARKIGKRTLIPAESLHDLIARGSS
jgi:excisionase family DNA binding protein